MSEVICKVWDPRKQQDYRVCDEKTNESISSLDLGLIVVEATGNVQWQTKACEVSKLFQKLSGFGHFVHHPWQKKSWYLLQKSLDIKNIERYDSGFICGNFAPEKARSLIEIWSKSGAWMSGEWLLIGYSSKHDSGIENSAQGLVHLLRWQKSLSIAIELREMKQSFLFARDTNDVIDDILNLFDAQDQS